MRFERVVQKHLSQLKRVSQRVYPYPSRATFECEQHAGSDSERPLDYSLTREDRDISNLIENYYINFNNKIKQITITTNLKKIIIIIMIILISRIYA